MTSVIYGLGYQPYIPVVYEFLDAGALIDGDVGAQLPGGTARSKGAAISVTPPSIASVTCEPQDWTILFYSRTDYDNIVCTYDADAEVEITVKGFGNGCRWGETDACDDTAATVEELAVWAITAQLALESIGLGYDKAITLKIDRLPEGTLGRVQLNKQGTIYLSHDLHNEDRAIPYDKTVMKHYVFHEYLHHAQLHPNTKLQNDSPLLITYRGPTKWLTEGTADWFGDEVDDSLNAYDLIAGNGDPFLEVGLNSPPDSTNTREHERDSRKRPYERFAFFKLLNEKCDDFPSQLKNLFNDRVGSSDSPDITGIRNLVRVLSEADCDFGDHLDNVGIDRSGSLEAALTYYNYATQSEGDIGLLDEGESNFNFEHSNLDFHPIPNRFELVDGFGEFALAYFDPEGDGFEPEYLISVIPAAGAYSVNFPIVNPSDLPEGSVAELVVKPKGGELVVSIAPHSETGSSSDFTPTNTIGPEVDSEPHTGFSTEESTTYLFSEARIPQVFVTVANASLTADIEVEILLRIRPEDDDPPTPPDAPTGDRAALVALYNATGGPNWTSNGNWDSDGPINSWHGVTTDSEGRVSALLLANNGLAGEIPSDLENLTNLDTLYLGNNDIIGCIPAELEDIERNDLKSLELPYCAPTITSPQPAAPENRAPVISSKTPASPVSVVTGSSQSFSATGLDADNNINGWEWFVDDVSQGGQSLALTGSSPQSFSYTFGSAGSFTVKVSFTDTEGESVTDTWTVQVSDTAPENRAPVITARRRPRRYRWSRGAARASRRRGWMRTTTSTGGSGSWTRCRRGGSRWR